MNNLKDESVQLYKELCYLEDYLLKIQDDYSVSDEEYEKSYIAWESKQNDYLRVCQLMELSETTEPVNLSRCYSQS